MSADFPECVLYAGPSAAGAALRRDGVELRPPAARGDIARLVSERPPGVLALADGVFHQSLSVTHAELRVALSRGWRVWGLSSLGAIRACEMRHLGVRGYGQVFRAFSDDANLADDEVALVHGSEAPFRPLSEPLVHLRLGLSALVEAGVITTAERGVLLGRLKRSWYGDRTLGFVKQAIVRRRPSASDTLAGWEAGFQRFRIKATDLEAFLDERPWRERDVPPGCGAGL